MVNINTSNLEVLSNKEQLELFKDLNENTRKRLILGNLKLVLSLLKKYQNRGNMDDLFEVGVIGLIKAIDNFDLKFNVCFSTYAVPMILGEMKRYLRDNTSLRISRSIKDNAYNIMKFNEEYINIYGKEPKKEIILDYFNLSDYDYYLAMNAKKDVFSLEEPIYDGIYLEDEIGSKIDFTDNIPLYDAINKLKDKEKDIIKKRYFIGKTQIELANEFNISQAQISRIEKSALKNIKTYMLK